MSEALKAFTVFYKHPNHTGDKWEKYRIWRPTAKMAGEEAVDMLPDDWLEDWEEEHQADYIRDELSVEVFEGDHYEAWPGTTPDWKFV